MITITRTHRARLSWPWLRWCLLDRRCRSHSCPPDLYIHPLGLIVRFRDDTDPWGISGDRATVVTMRPVTEPDEEAW